MFECIGNVVEVRIRRARVDGLAVVENRPTASSPLQRGKIMTDEKTDLTGLRVTHVADAPEGYQHTQNLPEIAPNDDFDGLRVIVHTLPLPTRIAMMKLGGPEQS
jgi:hypothetical protein